MPRRSRLFTLLSVITAAAALSASATSAFVSPTM